MANILKWKLKDLVDVIEGCTKNKFDCVVFIEGKRGISKSTLGFKICRLLKRRGIPFNPRKNLVYSRKDTIRNLSTYKTTCILSDELINVAYNRDHYEKDQKILIKTLNMYRDSCNVFIGCIPRFMDLDKQMQRLCKIRISVVRRGIALIHTQLQGIYRDDPWDIKNNIKVETDRKVKSMHSKISTPYAKLSTVIGIITYKDLTEKQKGIYERVKEERRNRLYMDYKENPLDSNKVLLDNLYNKMIKREFTKESFDLFCRTINKKTRYIRSRLNEMLKERGIMDKSSKDYFIPDKIKEKIELRKFNEKKKEKILEETKSAIEKVKIGDSSSVNRKHNENVDWWGEV